MATLTAMYAGQANSPPAHLLNDVSSDATSVSVDDGSILPSAPMWLTIGAESADAETVLLTGKTGNTLTVTRGQQGTVAKTWPSGTKVQRCFTAHDHNALIANIETLNADKQETITATGILKGDGSTVSAAAAGTDFEAAGTAATAVSTHDSDSGAHSTTLIPLSQKGALNGVATLDGFSGPKVMPEQISARRSPYVGSGTLSLSTAGNFVTADSETAMTITIPHNSSVNFPSNTEIEICRYGAGDVTIVPDTGVIVHCSKEPPYTIAEQYGVVALKRVGVANNWFLVGNVG
jgi:hypothetical protein